MIGLLLKRNAIALGAALTLGVVAMGCLAIDRAKDEGRAEERARAAIEAVRAEGRIDRANARSEATVRRVEAVRAERRRTVDRAAAETLETINAHAAADQPVDDAFARSWVAGLNRMCDAAGDGACGVDGPAARDPGEPDATLRDSAAAVV